MIQNLVVAFIWIFIVGGVTLIFISFVTERAKTRQSIDDGKSVV